MTELVEVGIGVVIVGGIVWAILVSRQQAHRKKDAIMSLREEKERLLGFNIHALVDAEVEDLKLSEIDGASGIPPEILLKAWRSHHHIVAGCSSRTSLRFVVAEGVRAGNATESDVTLVCTDPVDP